MSIPFVHSGNVLTLVLNGRSFEVQNDHPNFKKIVRGLKDLTEDQVYDLVVAKEEVKQQEGVVVNSDTVELVIDGQVVDPVLADEVFSLERAGLPTDGMINFIRKLYNNTSSTVVERLLDFIKVNGITVDSNVDIIGYKAVKNDWFDKYSGTISNAPGTTVRMKRHKVDDDHECGCSKGLHFGSLDYVATYGGGDDKIIIVRIDPANVVTVPLSCNHKKVRTCEYYVIGEYNGKLRQSVYQATDNVEEMYDSDEDDWDEEDDLGWDDIDEDDWDDDMDDETDDMFDEGDVEYSHEDKATDEIYSVKPPTSSQAGRIFYNKRGSDGKFSKLR